MTTVGQPPERFRPVGVALFGYGAWGGNHARVLSSTGDARLSGIVEPDPERREAARAAHPDVPVWRDAAAALRDPEVEAVVVATPAHTHARVAEEVVTAGRHVLVEKPFATRGRDAQQVARRARAAGVVSMAGHTFLYAQPVLNIARILREGLLDAPVFVRSERLGSRRRADCGALWNLAPHDVSILLYLLDSPVAEVSARSHVFRSGGSAGHDDATSVDLTFESGAAAAVQVSWRSAGKRRALSVLGETWSMEYLNRSGGDHLALDCGPATADQDALRQLLYEGCELADGGVRYREPLQAEVEHFARCCRTGETPRTGARHAIETARVLEAAERSASEGGAPVRLAAGKELAA
ncbi:Gfo/Idh/MocA family oxidoreductase [Streptantibioticus parmotrematis]|uniref:Gfo/Idh/MocA family protein n=1 Tax=Streptantibioticus parmotrematis TaxID=2873249 RepID=UPI003410FC69